MKCLLHIGTEKTGSTALQAYLFRNRKVLSREGFHVCQSSGLRNNRLLAQAHMRSWRVDEYFKFQNLTDIRARKAWRRSMLAAFSQEVAAASPKHHTFLVSSEHFHSRLISRGEVRMLATSLQSLFDEVEFSCYFRRQDEMAVSFYTTVLMAGNSPGSILPTAQGAQRTRSYYDFERLLNRWAAAFGKDAITPRVYHPTCLKDGEVAADFLDVLGVAPGEKSPPPRRLNTSLSAEAQQVLLWANSRLDGVPIARARAARGGLVEKLRQRAPGPQSLPSRQDVERFMRYYEESNARCARKWFGREQLFPLDFGRYPEEPYYGDPERVEELIQALSPLLDSRKVG